MLTIWSRRIAEANALLEQMSRRCSSSYSLGPERVEMCACSIRSISVGSW